MSLRRSAAVWWSRRSAFSAPLRTAPAHPVLGCKFITATDAKFAATHHADRVFVAWRGRMISPDLERIMTVRAKSETIERPRSHATLRLHPKEVAALIERAAKVAE
jgi:hypothetical protein